MEYKSLRSLNANPSLLGFGCMRFPTKENGEIDEAEAEKLLDYAIANGVNYIDTAYPYHEGNSEPFVGRVLKKYPRDRFYLATKLPLWSLTEPADVERIFEEQCRRLQTDTFDFYLLHALDQEKWQKTLNLQIIPFLEKKQNEGRIGHLGFSFHDDYDTFQKILLYRKWDFCQLQLNYMDKNIQAGMKGYQLAAQNEVPVIVMEPIKGGRLVNLPQEFQARFLNKCPDASLASWALRYVASLPNVAVVLSGMSSMEQVADNVKTFSPFVALNEKEQNIVDEVADLLHARVRNGCTGCGYCMPCPFGVNIPTNFKIWKETAIYAEKEKGQSSYRKLDQAAAEYCRNCGKCEALCPQHLPIRSDLKKVAAELTESELVR